MYSTLFGIGKLIFGATMEGLVMLAIALVAFLWIARSFRQEVDSGLVQNVGTGMAPRQTALPERAT